VLILASNTRMKTAHSFGMATERFLPGIVADNRIPLREVTVSGMGRYAKGRAAAIQSGV